eukprot:129619-Pyramimonas_sp.AAC.2
MVHGRSRRSEAEFTCTTAKGASHIDYLIAGPGAESFIVDLRADHNVPWGPRCGLRLKLRHSCQQLLTRSLTVASKLPQVSRPGTVPTPGPKSSRTKADRS